MTLCALQRTINQNFCHPFIDGVSATRTPSGNLIVKYKKHQVVFDHKKHWGPEAIADQLNTLKGAYADYRGLHLRIGRRDVDINDRGECTSAGTILI
jgi:hypothetical protein